MNDSLQVRALINDLVDSRDYSSGYYHVHVLEKISIG